jgi:mono/diheme cytochrome c family protein
MRRNWLWALVAAVVVAFAAFWLLTMPSTVSPYAVALRTADLANGRTMFVAGGCSSCHASPLQEDATRLGAGLGLKSKFGTFYVPNISPDTRDGIGAWTEAQFVTAVTKGTSPEGEHLFPAFPYTSFQRMRPDDVRDLFAYLKTLPPVSGKARDNDVPFPLNIRRAIGGWKLLYLDGKAFAPNPAMSAQWNRGAYLVEGPTHCAECHSPRNALGAIDAQKRFAGNPNAYGKLGFPNITQAKLKKWTAADFAEMLTSGLTPDGDRVGGPMVEVVRNTSQLGAGDRAAMGEYLKSLAPVASGGPK